MSSELRAEVVVGGPHRYLAPRARLEVGARSVSGVYVPRLFAAGDPRLLDEPAVAIVGSRAASPEGRAFAPTLRARS